MTTQSPDFTRRITLYNLYYGDVRFENKLTTPDQIFRMVAKDVKQVSGLMSGMMDNSIVDLMMLRYFKVSPRPRRSVRIVEVWCFPPPPQWTKCNINWAARGDTGLNIYREENQVADCLANVACELQANQYPPGGTNTPEKLDFW